MSCCTLGRRIVWVSLPKSHFILTSSCPTPTGNKNGRKCRLNMSCRTLGQRKCATVLPKRAALHPRATKMGVGVAQACRTLLSGDEKCGFRCRRVPFILTSFCLAPFGNENGLKCRLKVSYCTLERRKCTEVLPKRAALHPWATNSVGFVAEESHSSLRHSALHLSASIMDRRVTQACRAALSGDENVRKCCLSVPRYTHGQQKWTEVSPERAVLHSWVTILG